VVNVNIEESVSPAIFGERLRGTREESGLRVEDIVAETKVSKTIFDAMESGHFQFLPERVFSRSFVAQYARTVGADEEPLLMAFDAAWEQYSMSSGIHPNLEVIADDLGPAIRWRFWIPIAACGVILLIAAAVILRGSSSIGEGLAPDPRRSGVKLASETRAVLPATRPTPPLNSVKTAEEETNDPMVKVTVRVDPGEECWIHFRDRDGMTGQRLLTNGQHFDLELAGPVKLTVGNAGAVQLTVDGQIYRDLGLPGQVIHTEVTKGRFTPLGSEDGDTP
jgi:cytoskeleton protein RodZ